MCGHDMRFVLSQDKLRAMQPLFSMLVRCGQTFFGCKSPGASKTLAKVPLWNPKLDNDCLVLIPQKANAEAVALEMRDIMPLMLSKRMRAFGMYVQLFGKLVTYPIFLASWTSGLTPLWAIDAA